MIQVEVRGLAEAVEYARRLGYTEVPNANALALNRIAKIAHREAVRNAPKSPTQQELRSANPDKKRRKRNPRATSRPMPGGLERSIAYVSNEESADIYVSAGSEAGRYAFRIHSEKGVTWHKRGPGTVAKGGRADAWFILRALEDNQADFQRIFEAEHRKAAGK